MHDVITKRIALQASAVATGNGTSMNILGYDHVLVNIEGINGDTITFEVTENDSDWYAVSATNITSGTSATTATADGIFIAMVLGAVRFRARVSTYGSGTIIVNARAARGDAGSATGGGGGAVTNAGTFAVQVDGAALTALQLIDDVVYVDDADWTDSTSKHALVGGLYQSTPQTITDGDVGPILLDASGRQRVANPTAGDFNVVAWGWNGTSNVALTVIADDSAMPATPVSVPVAGEYRASATTYTDGDATVLQSDVNGNTKTTLATQIAGEDLTNDVMKTEQRFSGSAVLTADGQVKASAGFIHTITFSCNDAAPTAGSIIVYDNTAESGTVMYSETFDTTAFRGYTVILDRTFATGCYVGFTTTADINCVVSYR